MSEYRWHVIPQTRGWSALYLVISLAFLVTNGYQLFTRGASVFLVIGLAAGLALLVASIIGLVTQRSRDVGDVDRVR